MTLTIGAITRDEIWMVCDRRLSFLDKGPIDDAIKVFELVATDGVMLVSYAGLGITVGGMQPSEWLSNSLRNLEVTINQALGLIADNVEKYFAPQMRTVAWSSPFHWFHIVTRVGDQTSAYYIALARHPATGQIHIEKKVALVDLRRKRGPKKHIQVFGTTLSKWEFRALCRALSERAGGRLSPSATAKQLGAVNFEVFSRLKEKTVGPRCVVVFKDKLGGGQTWFYTGTQQDRTTPGIPAVTQGIDMQALFAGVVQEGMARAKAHEAEMREAMARKDHKTIQDLLMKQLENFPDMITANLRAMPKKNDTSIE